MARISLTPPRTLLARFAVRYSKRSYGALLDPIAALSHNSRVLLTDSLLELGVMRWRSLDPTLHCLATQLGASMIGCSWCTDFGYWEAHHKGVDPKKIRAVPEWRTSDVYTEVERLVLEYTEAMTVTPPAVTDELVERLRAHLTDEQLVELTMLVAVENLRSRTNAALGLHSQGFRDQCEVPQLVHG